MKKGTVLACTLATALLSTHLPVLSASHKATPMEKCYGIAKASKNDCGTSLGNACAGRVKQDKNPKAWIYVPKGTCNKITGGSLQPQEEQEE